MEYLVEKIIVPDKQSFMAREIEVGPENNIVHTHNNYELNFVKSGFGKRYVGDNISSFEKGDLVLLGPNLPHGWILSSDCDINNSRNIVIHFKEDFLGTDFIQTPELRPVLNILKKSALGIHFKGKKTEFVKLQIDKLLIEDGLKSLLRLLKIFDLLKDCKTYSYLSTPGYLSQAYHSDFKRINKIYEYIFLNFQNEVLLKEVSELVNLTPGAFCRYFKNKTNKTLFDFLKEVRIGYACKILDTTNKTVSEICYESGYNTIANFNNQFKELKHITPGEYRRKMK